MSSDVANFYIFTMCVYSRASPDWVLVTTEYQRMAHSWPQSRLHSRVRRYLAPGSPWLSPGSVSRIWAGRETEISAAVLRLTLAHSSAWRRARVGKLLPVREVLAASRLPCPGSRCPGRVSGGACPHVSVWCPEQWAEPSQTWSAGTGSQPHARLGCW